MATVKYDLPNIYVSEYQEFSTLFVLGANRTTVGSGSWVSPSSGLTYSYTLGQQDLFTQLQTFLEPYQITAASWNNMNADIEDAVVNGIAKLGKRIRWGLFPR